MIPCSQHSENQVKQKISGNVYQVLQVPEVGTVLGCIMKVFLINFLEYLILVF